MTIKDLIAFASAGWKPSDVKELLEKVNNEEEQGTQTEDHNDDPSNDGNNGEENGNDEHDAGAVTGQQTEEGESEHLLSEIENLKNQLKKAQALNVGAGSDETEVNATDILRDFMEDLNGYKDKSKK